MIKSILIRTAILFAFFSSLLAQDADPIEAARQAKLAAEKAAAEAEAATGAAIEAAAAKAAAAAREKVIADRKAEEERKRLEKEAAEAAEVDAAAEAAALEARRKLAAELGLELDEVADSSVTAELESNENIVEVADSLGKSPLAGFDFGASPSIGLLSGEAFSNVPIGATFVISTPYGFKVGALDLTVSLGFGGYTGDYNGTKFNPSYFGLGANGVLAQFVFSETHIGIVGKGLGVRQFAGVTLERLMNKGLNLPFNILVGGEGFISTNINGGEDGVTTGWGGLGVRLDYSF